MSSDDNIDDLRDGLATALLANARLQTDVDVIKDELLILARALTLKITDEEMRKAENIAVRIIEDEAPELSTSGASYDHSTREARDALNAARSHFKKAEQRLNKITSDDDD